MKGIIKFLFINSLLVLLIFGTSANIGGSTSVEPKQSEDVIIFAMPYNFDEYSVFAASTYATAQWNSAVYAGLVKRLSANNGNWGPDLAIRMPEVTTDGLTYSFELIPNLKFSNGNLLDTSDVEFSFNVALNTQVNPFSSGQYFGLLDESSVNVVDNLNIEFTFPSFVSFPFSLLSFPIVDEEYFSTRFDSCVSGVTADCTWNDPSGSDVVSAGPFMVSDIDTINQIVTVIANPNYYSPGSVQADKIIFKKIADKATAITELSSGSIDIMDKTYVLGLDEIVGLTGVSESFSTDLSHHEISLNHINPYFGTGEMTPVGVTDATAADEAALNVRKAMSHILNRSYVVNDIMQGLGQPASTSMSASSFGWDETIVPREFSIETARSYMVDAGFDYGLLGSENPDGTWAINFFEVTVLSPNTNPQRDQWALNYTLELPKIGIGVKAHDSTGWGSIIPRTFGSTGGTLVPGYDDGGFDIFFNSGNSAFEWDPSNSYNSKGRCDIGDCSNFYNFDVDETMTDVTSLISDYLGELDFDTRTQKVKLVQAELYEWIPILPIFYPQSHWGFRSGITGLFEILIGEGQHEWGLIGKTGFTINNGTVLTHEQPKPSQTSSPATSTSSSTTTNLSDLNNGDEDNSDAGFIAFPFRNMFFFFLALQIYNRKRKNNI